MAHTAQTVLEAAFCSIPLVLQDEKDVLRSAFVLSRFELTGILESGILVAGPDLIFSNVLDPPWSVWMSGLFRLYITSEMDHLSLRDARRFSGLGTDVQTTACQSLVNEFCPERVNIPVAGRDYSRRLSAEIVLVRNRNGKTVLSLCRDCGSSTVTKQGAFGIFSSETPALGQSNERGSELATSGVDKMRRASSGQHEGLPGQEFIASLKMIPEEWNLWR